MLMHFNVLELFIETTPGTLTLADIFFDQSMDMWSYISVNLVIIDLDNSILPVFVHFKATNITSINNG